MRFSNSDDGGDDNGSSDENVHHTESRHTVASEQNTQ